MRRSVVVRVAMPLAIIATIGVNAAANAAPISGLTTGDIAYGLVMPWAYVGIYARHLDVASAAVTSPLVAAIVLAVLAIVAWRGTARPALGPPAA